MKYEPAPTVVKFKPRDPTPAERWGKSNQHAYEAAEAMWMQFWTLLLFWNPHIVVAIAPFIPDRPAEPPPIES